MNFFKKKQGLITAQLILLVIPMFFLSFFFVNLNSVIFVNAQDSGGTVNVNHTEGLVKCQNPPNCTFEELMSTADAVVNFMIQLGVVLIAIIFAYAGWIYITANGDQDKIKQAHQMFSKAAIGLMIILLAFLIIELLVSSLGLDPDIIKLNK